jgi:hypothetical protein
MWVGDTVVMENRGRAGLYWQVSVSCFLLFMAMELRHELARGVVTVSVLRDPLYCTVRLW